MRELLLEVLRSLSHVDIAILAEHDREAVEVLGDVALGDFMPIG